MHMLSKVFNAVHTRIAITMTSLFVMSADVVAADNSNGLSTSDVSVLRSSGSGVDPVNTGYMAQLVLGLIIVLICIVALAWIAKRFNRLQSTPDGSLRVLGGMSMGARERIVLVQVGAKQLLLGVAPGQINTLHVLDEPLDAVTDASGPLQSRGFADKLSAALTRTAKRQN